MKKIKFILLITFIVMVGSVKLFAQGDQKYVQFSGFVIDNKSEEALPGAYIYVVNAGKGTITNSKGYFIINVFPGDTIQFSYLGFNKQYHVVPKTVGLNYSAVVEMQQDAKMLKEVKVYPFSTEEEFKRALVQMQLPDAQERKILEETFSQESVARMVAMQSMSADANYRFAMNQQLAAIQNKGMVTVNPLFSPTAWMSFINSVKKGGLKDDSWKGKFDNVPREKGGRDAIFKSGN